MAAGGNSNKRQKNTLAQRSQRAAGRDGSQREKMKVDGAFGRKGRPNRRASTIPGKGGGGGGGTLSKSDFTSVGTSKRPARKRKV